MRNYTAYILVIFLSFQMLSAQTDTAVDSLAYKNNWSIAAGFNTVNMSGQGTAGMFDLKNNWTFGNPMYISGEYYRNSKFSIALAASFNRFTQGKTVLSNTILQNNEASYTSIDGALKYSFRDLFNTKKFEPYVFIGGGVTLVSSYKVVENNLEYPSNKMLSFNTGIGFNYWFTKSVGINLNALGKIGIFENDPTILQGSFGFLYKIPKEKKTTINEVNN